MKMKKYIKKIFKCTNSNSYDSVVFSKKDIQNGKGMAIMSYVVPVIPFFVEKNNKFVVYHAKNGMNILVLLIMYSTFAETLKKIVKVNKSVGTIDGMNLGMYKDTPMFLIIILHFGYLFIILLCIIGIVNVCGGKSKELPIINKIKIFK